MSVAQGVRLVANSRLISPSAIIVRNGPGVAAYLYDEVRRRHVKWKVMVLRSERTVGDTTFYTGTIGDGTITTWEVTPLRCKECS